MNKRLLFSMVVMVVLVWLAGCCQSTTTCTSLIDDLRNEGATVESGGLINQSFFSVQGRIITINGSDVRVFEYENEVAAESDAALVSDDGLQVGNVTEGRITRITFLGWVTSPHFFMDGRVIVIYVGDDVGVLSILTKVLGAQFAGL